MSRKSEDLMARYKSYDRGQGYFLNFVPSEQFEEYSLEMVIDRFVEERISEDLFNHKYSNDDTGQKAIHPFIKLKVIIYSFCRGIQSSREMESMLKSGHMGYVFLSSHTAMDHSTLSAFINDFDKEINVVMSKLLMLLHELGLIDWKMLMIDGTKVSSMADKELTSDAKGFSDKLRRYRKLAKKIVERSKRLDREEEAGRIAGKAAMLERNRIERQKKKYESIIHKIEEYEEQVSGEEINGEEKINLTDRESRLLRDKEGYIQGYNVQTVYSANDIVVDIEAVSDSNDINQLKGRVDRVEEFKEKLSVDERSRYLADKGYCNPEQVADLVDDDKDVYCAIPQLLEKNWINDERYSVSKEDGLVFFNCAGGIKIKGYCDRQGNAYIFSVPRKKCGDCSHVPRCWEGREKQNKRKFKVSTAFVDRKDSWRSFCEKMNSLEGKIIYNKRIGKEHNFHDLKYLNGLFRVYRRGREKANTIARLAAIAHNMKKLTGYLKTEEGIQGFCSA